jgi:hypothetical protein
MMKRISNEQTDRQTEVPYSKRWKPIWSALSMPRSRSSRCAIVRHISLEGKGVCRKMPILARGIRRRKKDGKSMR